MNFVFLVTGILLVFVIGWLISSDRKHIRFGTIGRLFM
ncbi:Na+ dependent nucleoside transporter N-terminal domain-containing protein, partial [Oenococcus oeni]